MGGTPVVETSTKSTQTDGKYHVSPSLALGYTSILAAMDNSSKSKLTSIKKKKNSDLMVFIEDI
jgi:hypothetical protein